MDGTSLKARLLFATLLSIATAYVSVIVYGATGEASVEVLIVPIGAAFVLFRGFIGKVVGAIYCGLVVFVTLNVIAEIRDGETGFELEDAAESLKL